MPGKSFSFTKQLDAMDCGPACLKMVADHYGRHYSLQRIRELCHISTSRVSLAGIADAAEKIGLRSLAVKINFHSSDIRPGLIDFPLPCIAHWHQNHFVVIYKIRRGKVYIADPGHANTERISVIDQLNWSKRLSSRYNIGSILILKKSRHFRNTR